MLKLYLTEIHLHGGGGHEHISKLRWRNPSGGKCGSSSVVEMIGWLEEGSVEAFVRYGSEDVAVYAVEAVPPYLRSHADGTPNDNLLSLPRY